MKVTILHAAWPGYTASIEWYESQQDGLGGEFFKAVQATADQIGEAPLRYPIDYRDARASAGGPLPLRSVLRHSR